MIHILITIGNEYEIFYFLIYIKSYKLYTILIKISDEYDEEGKLIKKILSDEEKLKVLFIKKKENKKFLEKREKKNFSFN